MGRGKPRQGLPVDSTNPHKGHVFISPAPGRAGLMKTKYRGGGGCYTQVTPDGVPAGLTIKIFFRIFCSAHHQFHRPTTGTVIAPQWPYLRAIPHQFLDLGNLHGVEAAAGVS